MESEVESEDVACIYCNSLYLYSKPLEFWILEAVTNGVVHSVLVLEGNYNGYLQHVLHKPLQCCFFIYLNPPSFRYQSYHIWRSFLTILHFKKRLHFVKIIYIALKNFMFILFNKICKNYPVFSTQYF